MTMATIKEIGQQLAQVTSLDDPLFEALSGDARAGVARAIAKRQRELQADLQELARLEQMLTYEKAAYAAGFEHLAGVDEVGRGPLAGPVVASAVILPKNCKIKGLNDSKKIPKAKHQAIYDEVMATALAVGIGVISPEVIDEVNIYEATKLAMQAALADLTITPDYLLIDAMQLPVELPQEKIIKGDAKSMSIAAASIVAKVTRDQLMVDYDQAYPGYGLGQNAGYGTAQHLQALEKQGISPIHRRSFEPIKSMLGALSK